MPPVLPTCSNLCSPGTTPASDNGSTQHARKYSGSQTQRKADQHPSSSPRTSWTGSRSEAAPSVTRPRPRAPLQPKPIPILHSSPWWIVGPVSRSSRLTTSRSQRRLCSGCGSAWQSTSFVAWPVWTRQSMQRCTM